MTRTSSLGCGSKQLFPYRHVIPISHMSSRHIVGLIIYE